MHRYRRCARGRRPPRPPTIRTRTHGTAPDVQSGTKTTRDGWVGTQLRAPTPAEPHDSRLWRPPSPQARSPRCLMRPSSGPLHSIPPDSAPPCSAEAPHARRAVGGPASRLTPLLHRVSCRIRYAYLLTQDAQVPPLRAWPPATKAANHRATASTPVARHGTSPTRRSGGAASLTPEVPHSASPSIAPSPISRSRSGSMLMCCHSDGNTSSSSLRNVCRSKSSNVVDPTRVDRRAAAWREMRM